MEEAEEPTVGAVGVNPPRKRVKEVTRGDMKVSNLSNLVIPLMVVIAIAIMALVMYSDIIKSKLYGDRRLFYTYTPQAYQPGTVTDDGKTITRVVEVIPTMTTDGGSVRCFEVRGR